MIGTLGVLLYQQERAAGPDNSSYRKMDQLLETREAAYED